MKRRAVAGLLLSVLVSWGCWAGEIRGKVIGIADGDTVTVLDEELRQHKVRLAGIDAPEKKQAFGQRSKDSLAALVFGKTVAVETNKRDKYGRNVGVVWADGVDANLQQLILGMAWHYKEYAHEQSEEDRLSYSAAENSARSQMLGLWRDSTAIPPWTRRHQQRIK